MEARISVTLHSSLHLKSSFINLGDPTATTQTGTVLSLGGIVGKYWLYPPVASDPHLRMCRCPVPPSSKYDSHR